MNLTTLEISLRLPLLPEKLTGSEKSVAGQRGTLVSVRHLFQDLFVRLTHARKHPVTVAKVKSMILTYAFVRQVRFVMHFRQNKRVDWTIQASADPMITAQEVFGKETMQQYQSVSWTEGGITIKGILPHINAGSPPPEDLI